MLIRAGAVVIPAASSAGCQLATGIFKAGFWAGILVAVVLVLVFTRLFRRS
jgi:hypothetical protein